MQNKEPKVGVVIVAAGSSTRMKGVDKIFMDLSGKSVLEWTVDRFEESPKVSSIVLVVHESKVKEGLALAVKNEWEKVSAVCVGGARRQDSVNNGIKRLQDCDYIMVHDGARPCVSDKIIEDGLENAMKYGAAIPGVKLSDTIKKVDNSGFIHGTINREELIAVQTPQVFSTKIITEAYSKIKDNVTDDASLVEALGHKVKIFEGSAENIKITTREDIRRVEHLLKARDGSK